jgi:hypothetical protein
MTDQWNWWRAALKGTFGPNHIDEPQAGFYRSRSRSKTTGEVTFRPIAYWYTGTGELRCKLGDTILADIRAREQWPFVAEHPITRELYDAVRAGGPWPGEHPAAAADRKNSNTAPEDNSLEATRDRIEDLAREAEKVIAAGAATTKAAADRAADLADRLLAREKSADVRRREEMRPHEEAAKAVDAQWRPLRDRAADCKARLKKLVVTPFLLAIEAANKKAEGEAVRTGRPVEAAPRQTVGTTTSTALRTVTSAVIEDYAKTLAYFADNAQVRELVQKLANASARAGTCPDGCRINTDKAAA